MIAGRYRLRERIGEGRLGEIFAADDEAYRGLGVRKSVAVQVLRDGLASNDQMIAGLRWGFGTLRDDAHPCIVSSAEFGHDGMFGYLVMEQLEGASMRELLRIETSFDFDDTSAIVRAAGNGVTYLHSRSMVHGNLSPGNVFVTFDHDVKLLDIVPLAPAEAGPVAGPTPTGAVPLSVHDDVFGLAALAYEMLTGRHPYNHCTPADLPAGNLRPARIESLTERQWRAMLKALSPVRDQRFASVEEFLRETGIDGSSSLPSLQRTPPASGIGGGQDWQPEIAAEQVVVKSATLTASVAPSTPEPEIDEPLRVSAVPAGTASPSRNRRFLPSSLLTVVLLGLAGWQFLGQPRDDIAAISEFADPILARVLVGIQDLRPSGVLDGDTTMPSAVPPTIDPAPARSTAASEASPGPEIDDPGISAPATSADGKAADLPDIAAAIAFAEPAVELQPESQSTDPVQPSVDEGNSVAAASGRPPFEFSESTVRVSEGAGAVRVTIIRAEEAEGRVFWWTSDASAKGELDFIATDSPTPGFA